MPTLQPTERARLLDEALAAYRSEHWNAAGEAYERAQALAPLDAESNYRLGNVREEQGRDAEAAACFERAVALDASFARAWNNLGGALQRMGREPEAERAYLESVARDATLIEPRLNLGRLAEGRNDLASAARHYREALVQRPGDPLLEHLVAATGGQRTPRAPSGYVSALFDAQATQFDRHLVADLGYRVPEALVALARPAIEACAGTARVLDLGCGTGLVGAALTGAAPGGVGLPRARIALTGVDLSQRMLALAAKRGVYETLRHGELLQALDDAPPASHVAVFAADVLIYIGEVRALILAVAGVLAPGGVFAFSVERLVEGDYRLMPSGRYAHAIGYLQGLAREAGLLWRQATPARIRREQQGWAEGELVLLEQPRPRPPL